MDATRMRSISMPMLLSRNRSPRLSEAARSVISLRLMPPICAAAIRAPMLVPANVVGVMPRSARARRTPMCAKPFSPPPPSTTAMRGGGPPPPPNDIQVPNPVLLEVQIQTPEPDACATDHDERSGIVADDRAGQ